MLNQPSTLWIGCAGGHLLRPGLSAPERRLSDWVDEALMSDLATSVSAAAPAVRQAAAEAWKQAALELHYGILEGSRLTLELMAVGAPGPLLDACEAGCSSLAELATHAFSVASGYSGSAVTPLGVSSPAPLRVTPGELAQACFLEGICGGGLLLQALELQRQAGLVPAVAALNVALSDAARARQELAFQTLSWLMDASQGAAALDSAQLDSLLASFDLLACDYSLLPLLASAGDSGLLVHGLLNEADLTAAEADFRCASLPEHRQRLREMRGPV